MQFSRGGVIPEEEILASQSGQPVFDMRSGKFIKDLPSASTASGDGVDPVVTGKIDPKAGTAPGDLKQAFPGNGVGYEVLAVDGSHALVGDSDGVYLVRAQSRLPDGTFARSFKRDDTGWYIVTSDDKILRPL